MQMVLFSLLNYEDYILKTILTSSYAHNTLTVVLMYLATAVIKFHISVFLSWILVLDTPIDYVVPVIVNVILSFLSNTLYQHVNTHRDTFELIVDYLMCNYSRKNIIIWKRYFLSTIFAYILIVLFLIPVDNLFLIIGTLQTAASFIICDILENRDSVRQHIEHFIYRPKVTKLLDDFHIIHNYPNPEPSSPIPSPNISPKIPTKPLTPPLIANHYKKLQ